MVSVESLREKLLFGVESKGAGVADASDFEMTGVVGRREVLRIGSW